MPACSDSAFPDGAIPPSPSTDELIRHLESADAAIREHERQFSDLHKTRSEWARALNRVRDPLARLPVEMCIKIFNSCREDRHWRRPLSKVGPMILLSVCHAWSDLARSTPRLWREIYLNQAWRGKAEIAEAWFSRASTSLVSLVLESESSVDSDIVHMMSKHALRVEALELHIPLAEVLFFPGPWLALRKLTIREGEERMGDGTVDNPEPLDVGVAAGLLCGAPSLHQCCFDRIVFGKTPASQVFRHSNLRCLDFGPGDTMTPLSDRLEVLRWLDLPALESLSIPGCDLSPSDLLAFLRRSSPALRSLLLGVRRNQIWTVEEVETLCRLVPTLTSGVFIHADKFNRIDERFPILRALESQELLPNILNIRIGAQFEEAYMVTEDYLRLIGVLANRRQTLKAFRLVPTIRGWPPREPLDPAVVTGIEGLSENGIDIDLGRDLH
ncbi:hypothetical protein C8R43DRAFT_1118505 [Mycena crocata]|nr:hypothetical protein C8R43DRAFT_1143574 [Mycena crocata]KAJ7177517.1 hypothetical protein C8R43DRAFT_1118505 [Mycena crocata]